MTTCFCEHDAARVDKADTGEYWFFRGESNFRLCPYCGAWCVPETGNVVGPSDTFWLGDPLGWPDSHHLRQFVRTLLGIRKLKIQEEPYESEN